MMKHTISSLVLAAALCGLTGAAAAQPSGGPDAKGNAPLKAAHTVNDGGAKPGANSFTEGQARQHIQKSGFADVGGLTKGADGVWRGSAMKGGQTVNVAMDFKGNVTTSAAASSGATTSVTTRSSTAAPAPSVPPEAAPAAMQTTHRHRRHHHHHRHHASSRCAAAMQAGAACSGVDRNQNGISDKEDRAISH